MSTNKALAPSITHRDPKGRKFVSVVEAAYDKTGLSDEEAQRVNDTPGLAGIIDGFIADNRRPNQFINEEVSSNYTYPEGYHVRPIAEQVARLQEIFPELNGANLEIAKGELPTGAEGWFAIGRWDKLGKSYNEVFEQRMIPALEATFPKFYNYRKGELSAKYLRQHQRTTEMYERLASEQEGYDILIVPAQFGLRHRGRSVRRAREIFIANEFGLGAFAVGCMLLTHPERLVRWEQLHVDCGGDEYDWTADGGWTDCPYFSFHDDRVELDADGVGYVGRRFGAASGFLGSVSVAA